MHADTLCNAFFLQEVEIMISFIEINQSFVNRKVEAY